MYFLSLGSNYIKFVVINHIGYILRMNKEKEKENYVI